MITIYLKKIFLLTTCLLAFATTMFGQETIADSEFQFQSSGTPPPLLTKALEKTPKYISYPIGNQANFNNNSDHPIFDRLLCSGRLIYGNSEFDFGELKTNLIKKDLLNSSDQLICLKSNVSAVFYDEGVYLITTNLLSQATNWENIIFLMLRAKIRTEMNLDTDLDLYLKTESIDDLVDLYYNINLETEKAIDQKGAELFIKNGFNAADIMRSLDVVRFSDLPFEDYHVPKDYFSGEYLFIPDEFLKFNNFKGASVTENQFGKYTENLTLQQRKESLEQEIESDITNVSEPTAAFLKMRTNARLQIIEEQIIANKFEQALYSVFIMRKDETEASRNYLDRMKAHTWCGLVRSRYSYSTKRYPSIMTSNNQTESNRFFHIMKKFNSYAIAGLGLRYLTDIAKNNEAVASEVILLRQEMIDELARSERFPIEKFSATELVQSVVLDEQQTDSKYDKIDKLSNEEVLSEDTSEFYFYAIPDLVSTPSFMASFNVEPQMKKSRNNQSKLITTEVYKYKKRGFKQKKSDETKKSILEDLSYVSKRSGIAVSNKMKETDEQELLELAEINQILLQNYLSDRNSVNIFPVSYARLDQTIKSATPLVFHTQFVDEYKLKGKGYYFIGLLIIPLPFVVTDLFVNGSNSNYLAFEYNTETRKISYFENSKVTYPWNSRSTKSQIISTLKIIDNE